MEETSVEVILGNNVGNLGDDYGSYYGGNYERI